MFQSKTKLIINLQPSRLSVARVVGTRVKQAESLTLDPADWDSAWGDNLLALDAPLRQLIARLNIRGRAEVSVLYHSANTVSQFMELPGSRADAEQAAKIRVRESVGRSAPADSIVLAHSANQDGSWLVFAVTDRDEDTRKLYAWVSRCGGCATQIVPRHAALVRSAIDSALSNDENHATCAIGSEASVLAIGNGDAIFMARSFEIGYRSVAEAFQRALGSPDKTLSYHDAETSLFETGIPSDPSTSTPELRTKVLPLVSPILQRISVEIKQSIRFGVPSGCAPAYLLLAGPGGRVPHLSSVLTEAVDMHCKPDSSTDPIGCTKPFGIGTLEREFAESKSRYPSLLPAIAREEAALNTAKKIVLTGGVAAALLVAAEFGWIAAKERAVDQQIQAIAPQIASIDRERAARTRANTIALAAGQVAWAIETDTPDRIHWPQALAAIAAATNDAVMLDNIVANSLDAGPEARLTGYVSAASDAESAAALTNFVRTLSESPILASVTLGSTARGTHPDGRHLRQFEITIGIATQPSGTEPLAEYARQHAAGMEDM